MKKFFTVFFAFTLYFNLITEANAANLGGWTLGNPVAQGASAVVNATKTAVINGANVIKNSTAKITPPASSVAKVLARGAAGYALSVAVEQLLGSVDWVLDPANNRVVYSAQYGGTNLELYKPRCLSDINAYTSSKNLNPNYARATYKVEKRNNTVVCLAYLYAGDSNYNLFATYPITGEDGEQKTIPLETVAQQVISNAAAGDASAQQAIVAAAQDIINEAETDNTKARPIVQQLDQNAQTVTAEDANKVTGQTKPNTQNPDAIDISLEFPAFCGWAPLVCEAAQTVISFPATLTEWWETANEKADSWATSISEAWTAAKQWATSEDGLPEKEEIEQPTELPAESKTYNINWSAQCPTAQTVPISFHGVTAEITVADFSYLCSLDWLIKPFVIAFASISAAFIIFGFNRGGDDG